MLPVNSPPSVCSLQQNICLLFTKSESTPAGPFAELHADNRYLFAIILNNLHLNKSSSINTYYILYNT